MEIVITTERFTELQSKGRVYICRPCFDNRKLIKMLAYDAGARAETLAGVCAECSKALAACVPCQSKPPSTPRNP
jgi:hypothetical protein